MKNRWYDSSVEELCEKLHTDPRAGLSAKEALTRQKTMGKNTIYPISKASFKSYLKHVITDLTAILLFLAAAAAALFEKNTSAMAILVILTINYLISIVCFVRSQRILEEAASQSLPNAKVIRDGKLSMVRAEELVRGDIILVSAGDIVPCDARLIECDGLFVLESNLYDNAVAVRKRADYVDARNLPIKDRVNMLYASGIVTEGRGRAIVCDTGASTLVCVQKKNPTIANHDKLGIILRLKKYSTIASLFSIAMVFLLTILNFYFSTGSGIYDVFLMTLSLAVSSMSELYTAFAYIIISLGIFGAVRQFHRVNTGAVIKNASSIERMKNLDCILVPKESLFLEREMKLSSIYCDGAMYSPSDPKPARCTLDTLRFALISTGLYGAGKLVSNNVSANNVYTPEEESIIRAARQCGLYDRRLDMEFPLVEHVGVNRESRFPTTLFRNEGNYRIALRGDARTILGHCTSYRSGNQIMTLSPTKRSEFIFDATRLMRDNYRVIAIATKNSPYNSLKRLPACQNDLIFEGYICIKEPILPDAAQNIARCKNAGIRVIMFTSDISESNRSLAKTLGIAEKDEDMISIAQLSQMKDAVIRANLSHYNLYEGLNNAQLRYILRWLKEDLGYEIGVLGRKLEDVGLIRDADVGFTEVMTLSGSTAKDGVEFDSENMPLLAKNAKDSGRYGCEALKFISDVALSKPNREGEGGFNAMIAAIASSKAIYLNIYRTVRYLLLSHSTRLFFVLLATFTDIILLQPHQMLFTGAIMDLLAVFVIAFTRADPLVLLDRNDYEKKLNLLPVRQFPLVLLGLWWGMLSLAMLRIAEYYQPGYDVASQCSLVFVSFVICQIVVLLSICNQPLFSGRGVRVNFIYILAVFLTIGFLILAFKNASVGNFISLVPIQKIGYYLMAIPAFGTLIALEIYKSIADRKKKKT